MRYLDCYMSSDIDGFPSATYLVDVDGVLLDKAMSELNQSFDRVESVGSSNGQSPLRLSAVIMGQADTSPTLINAVRGAQA